MLAETVKVDGGLVALIIVLFVLFLVISIGTVVLGFVMAPRAARGSQTAMGWWIVALALEGLACLSSLGALTSGGLNWRIPIVPLIVAAQVAIFFRAKRNAG